MPVRDIYLKIEPIFDYSPVDPDPASPVPYRRDCMRNMGHEDATIPISEVNARKLTALVYREYLDPNYLVPKPDKIVLADVNEPAFHRRVPGAVLYAKPGDRLHIHVLNGDVMPHSLHMHGVEYGIDSDGSWPFGTQSSDGRRSDEICPGDSWTYTFDVTNEMIGAWPFHDHWRHIGDDVNRGLFGGLSCAHATSVCQSRSSSRTSCQAVIEELIKRPPRGTIDRRPGPATAPARARHRPDGASGCGAAGRRSTRRRTPTPAEPASPPAAVAGRPHRASCRCSR